MEQAKKFLLAHKSGLQRLGAVVLALALWQVLAMSVGQQLLVPSPLSVVRRLGVIWREEGFWSTVWFTFRKIVAGFLLALVLGVSLGALAGRFPLFEILFRPYAVMIKSVPVASFIVICLIWMSSSRLSVFISFLMVLPIVYNNVLQGIRAADRQLLEMAQVFHLSWGKRVLYLWLPQLKPYLFSACGVSLGIAWKAGIAAEIIGIPSGSIGQMFYNAKIYFNTADLFAWTVIVVVVSVLFEKLFLALLGLAYGRLEKL
jgi:NitT/TauT family transport system permease protein